MSPRNQLTQSNFSHSHLSRISFDSDRHCCYQNNRNSTWIQSTSHYTDSTCRASLRSFSITYRARLFGVKKFTKPILISVANNSKKSVLNLRRMRVCYILLHLIIMGISHAGNFINLDHLDTYGISPSPAHDSSALFSYYYNYGEIDKGRENKSYFGSLRASLIPDPLLSLH